MNRRGFVLLSMLWVVVLLSGVAFGVMERTRVETTAHRNRIIEARAAWGRSACQQILEARFAEHAGPLVLDPIDLGRRAWCRATLVPIVGLVDLNRSAGPVLRSVIGQDSLVAALLDWIDADSNARVGGSENPWYRSAQRRLPRNGPVASVDELEWVRGFSHEVIERLRPKVIVVPLEACDGACGATTFVAEIEAGVGASPIRAYGRVVYRDAGHRLAVLLQEME